MPHKQTNPLRFSRYAVREVNRPTAVFVMSSKLQQWATKTTCTATNHRRRNDERQEKPSITGHSTLNAKSAVVDNAAVFSLNHSLYYTSLAGKQII